MTDQPNDDDLGQQLAAQEQIYNAAIRSDVTVVATAWLARAYLLTGIAGDDMQAAATVIDLPAGQEAANREYEQLSEAERAAVLELVGLHWSLCVKRSIELLWHVCGKLRIDPTDLDNDHVALHAATLLSDRHLVPFTSADADGED